MKRLVLFAIPVLLLVFFTTSVYAANKIYVVPETALIFGDAAQTPTAQLTLTSLAAGAGRISILLNRGAGAHAAWYQWRCRASLTGTNTPGQGIELYLGTSDGTNPDGQIGAADGVLDTEKRRNLLLLGVLQVDQATTNTTMTASGLVYVVTQYLAVGVWNGTSLPFEASTTKHRCTLTPWPQEIQ